jgi:uncharacterized protein (DUF2147 family)
MIKQTIALALLGVCLGLGVGAAADDGGAILGVWATERTENGNAHVEISKNGGKYRGQIIWLEQPNYPQDDDGGMGGQPKVDRANPDEKLRSRPIIGLRLIDGSEYAGDKKWKNGTIYDPETGKTYKCKMRLTDEGVLKVRGYIGFSLLGRTTEWTRPTSK